MTKFLVMMRKREENTVEPGFVTIASSQLLTHNAIINPRRITMELAQLIPRLIKSSNSPVTTCPSMQAWFEKHQVITADIPNSLARALIAGATFRQVSFAFASAYQSALENMFCLDQSTTAALCNNEKGVKKPREMQSCIYEDEGVLKLDTRKGFVSGGVDAKTLFVSVIDRRANANSEIVLLKLDNTNNRLALEELPPLPFVPELSHAKFLGKGIHIHERDILEGDGYTDYVKPFRTEEDLHILAALCGQRLSIAFELQKIPLADQLLAITQSIMSMQSADRNCPATHLLLSGLKKQLIRLFLEQDAQLETEMPEFSRNWKRDSALLSLAEGAQQIRTQKAWNHFLDLG